MSATPIIVYFDGVCGLCNRTVDFLVVRDTGHRLLFTPLQGETAQARLTQQDVASLNTLVISWGDRIFRRSAAVTRVLWQLPGIWKCVAAALWIIPIPLRDWGYRMIARNRYRVFGKKDVCRLPSPEERDCFLP
jgi:predicted DCC family thiol-disulfide oxidoreductase YuxK